MNQTGRNSSGPAARGQVMHAPNSIDAVEWARWNEYVAQQAVRMLGDGFGDKCAELLLEPYAVEVVELPPAIQDLTLAVNRAASELHGQGEKSDRIATQLLTALARFAAETGT